MTKADEENRIFILSYEDHKNNLKGEAFERRE